MEHMNLKSEEIFKRAKKEAKKYKELSQFINWDSIEQQAIKRYPNGVDLTKILIFNLLEALIAPPFSISKSVDYKLNLDILEKCIGILKPYLNIKARKSLKEKISNLGNTAFWDTVGELWLAQRLVKTGQRIEIEYELHPSQSGNKPADADIAIINTHDGSPIWLIDVICPNMPKRFLLENSESGLFNIQQEAILDWLGVKIEKKFQSKFLPYVSNFSNVNIAIIVIILKADEITPHFFLNSFPMNKPSKLPEYLTTKYSNLKYAVAGRFQRINEDVQFIKLAEIL